jgi:hypothetical protein
VTENLAALSEDQLERMLLDASSLPGRAAMARVTAIRTILRRRPQRAVEDVEADARRALELVNAVRGPGDQLTEVHPTWVDSILADSGWAEVYASDDEMQQPKGLQR